MTLLCCLLSLAYAGPSGSGDTGTATTTTPTATGTGADTGTTTGTETTTDVEDTAPPMVSAAGLADEVGGCRCSTSSGPGGAPLLMGLALLLVARRRA